VWRFLRRTERADDSGCPEVAEEGNAVGMRHKAHAPIASTRDRCGRTGDASFARSFDPCASILTMLCRGNSRRWGVSVGITVGQTHASEKNHHWGRHGRTKRGSPRTTAPAREKAWFVRKGRRSRPPSLRGSRRESGFGCPHVEVQLQKSVGDGQASNKLGKRAPKRAAGSSERGSSSERRSAGETVGRRLGRKVSRGSTSPQYGGRGSERDPG